MPSYTKSSFFEEDPNGFLAKLQWTKQGSRFADCRNLIFFAQKCAGIPLYRIEGNGCPEEGYQGNNMNLLFRRTAMMITRRSAQKHIALVLILLSVPALSFGQGSPASGSKAAGKPAAAQSSSKSVPVSPIDKVIQLAKAGTSEEMILKVIAKENLRADLSSEGMIRLKQAGVTDRVISALMDAPPAAPAVQPNPAPSAPPAAPAPAAPAPAPGTPDSKARLRRAAIDEFDWAAVKTAVNDIFKTEVDIGKGIRAMLTKRLQEAGKIRIVERAKIKTLMGEQDFGSSNRVKKGTNAGIGKIMGADVYLMGDIVTFGRDDKDNRVKAGAITNKLGRFGGLINIGKKEEKAVVVINYRFVDTETSEVIDSGEARGESSRKSKGLGGLFGISGTAVGGSVDMTSSNFAETIIGEATMNACDKLAEIINAKVPSFPMKQVDVEARVADVNGPAVTITAGSNDGVLAGDRFEVFRILSTIIDPQTKEVLDNQVEKTGDMVITSVRERVSTGQYTGSPIAPDKGLVRKKAQ
jgi:curli biogenesis system outer membrane secretion channel CsgG